jgi:predicted enzyme involved in methoxymalonyl-ACP biosynthesis
MSDELSILGREVEQACLNVISNTAAAVGAARLEGVYRHTERNMMVKDL